MKLNISRREKRKLKSQSRKKKKEKKKGKKADLTVVVYDPIPHRLSEQVPHRVLITPYVPSFPLKEAVKKPPLDLTVVLNNSYVHKDISKGIATVFIKLSDTKPVSVELW